MTIRNTKKRDSSGEEDDLFQLLMMQHSQFMGESDSNSSNEAEGCEDDDSCSDGSAGDEQFVRIQQPPQQQQPPEPCDGNVQLPSSSTSSSQKADNMSSGRPPCTPSTDRQLADSFYTPPTASAPVTSHFDALLECLDLLRTMERDQSVNKQDVIDSLRSMLNNMLSTVLMHSFATSMSVRGWRVE